MSRRLLRQHRGVVRNNAPVSKQSRPRQEIQIRVTKEPSPGKILTRVKRRLNLMSDLRRSVAGRLRRVSRLRGLSRLRLLIPTRTASQKVPPGTNPLRPPLLSRSGRALRFMSCAGTSNAACWPGTAFLPSARTVTKKPTTSWSC